MRKSFRRVPPGEVLPCFRSPARAFMPAREKPQCAAPLSPLDPMPSTQEMRKNKIVSTRFGVSSRPCCTSPGSNTRWSTFIQGPKHPFCIRYAESSIPLGHGQPPPPHKIPPPDIKKRPSHKIPPPGGKNRQRVHPLLPAMEGILPAFLPFPPAFLPFPVAFLPFPPAFLPFPVAFLPFLAPFLPLPAAFIPLKRS